MIDINKLLGSKRVEVSFPETAVDGAYVKLFRADHRLTQAALANIMGVKKKTIEKWEQGVNKVSGSSAVLLKLLRDDPELIGRLYKVQAVSGKTETDDYTPIDRKVINGTVKTAAKSGETSGRPFFKEDRDGTQRLHAADGRAVFLQL